MPDLYGYIDYRKYLKDYYEEQKARDPKFSHRYFAAYRGQDPQGQAGDQEPADVPFGARGKRDPGGPRIPVQFPDVSRYPDLKRRTLRFKS
jgi:hypothetical protein